MLKYILLPSIIIFMLSACNQQGTNKSLADSLHTADSGLKAVPQGQMIVPGKRIGHIYINADADSLTVALGKPKFNDAAMGALLLIWNAWHNKHIYETATYSHRKMGGADDAESYVKEIRTTSPRFKTADFAGAGSELKDVMKIYKLKKYPLPGTGPKNSWLYDDYNAGIGFEVDSNGKCTAVLVHIRGDSSVVHINMHP